MANGQKDKTLSGIRVLDLTRYLSGPQTNLFLAALGADVVKVDDPKLGDPVASAPSLFSNWLYNKNLKAPLLGEHNKTILGGICGLDKNEISSLYKNKVITADKTLKST